MLNHRISALTVTGSLNDAGAMETNLPKNQNKTILTKVLKVTEVITKLFNS